LPNQRPGRPVKMSAKKQLRRTKGIRRKRDECFCEKIEARLDFSLDVICYFDCNIIIIVTTITFNIILMLFIFIIAVNPYISLFFSVLIVWWATVVWWGGMKWCFGGLYPHYYTVYTHGFWSKIIQRARISHHIKYLCIAFNKHLDTTSFSERDKH